MSNFNYDVITDVLSDYSLDGFFVNQTEYFFGVKYKKSDKYYSFFFSTSHSGDFYFSFRSDITRSKKSKMIVSLENVELIKNIVGFILPKKEIVNEVTNFNELVFDEIEKDNLSSEEKLKDSFKGSRGELYLDVGYNQDMFFVNYLNVFNVECDYNNKVKYNNFAKKIYSRINELLVDSAIDLRNTGISDEYNKYLIFLKYTNIDQSYEYENYEDDVKVILDEIDIKISNIVSSVRRELRGKIFDLVDMINHIEYEEFYNYLLFGILKNYGVRCFKYIIDILFLKKETKIIERKIWLIRAQKHLFIDIEDDDMKFFDLLDDYNFKRFRGVWIKEEDIVLTDLVLKGYSYDYIYNYMCRAHSSLDNRLKKLELDKAIKKD